MAFYKLCDCGTKNLFEHRGMAPRKCKNCGRSLLEVSVTDEEDEAEEQESAREAEPAEEPEEEQFFYSLDTLDGKSRIVIPAEGAVIGRAALGAELLAEHRAVSREHIYVAYRGRIGLQIEDRSKFGTFVNGEQMIKGTAKFARDGDVIRLYNFELKVKRHEED